jgi:hypothetical protein
MKALLLISPFLILSLACNKDKFQTKPSIKVKSITNQVADPGTDVQVTLTYTDKEGDLGNGELMYIVHRLNIKPIPGGGAGIDQPDTIRYTLPEFPDKSKGEIQVRIPYDFLNEDLNDNDTLQLKMAVRDMAGNASDTLQTETIIARQN